jgi:hypothetical protein
VGTTYRRKGGGPPIIRGSANPPYAPSDLPSAPTDLMHASMRAKQSPPLINGSSNDSLIQGMTWRGTWITNLGLEWPLL